MNFDPNGEAKSLPRLSHYLKRKRNALREFYRIDEKFVELGISGIDNIISL